MTAVATSVARRTPSTTIGTRSIHTPIERWQARKTPTSQASSVARMRMAAAAPSAAGSPASTCVGTSRHTATDHEAPSRCCGPRPSATPPYGPVPERRRGRPDARVPVSAAPGPTGRPAKTRGHRSFQVATGDPVGLFRITQQGSRERREDLAAFHPDPATLRGELATGPFQHRHRARIQPEQHQFQAAVASSSAGRAPYSGRSGSARWIRRVASAAGPVLPIPPGPIRVISRAEPERSRSSRRAFPLAAEELGGRCGRCRTVRVDHRHGKANQCTSRRAVRRTCAFHTTPARRALSTSRRPADGSASGPPRCRRSAHPPIAARWCPPATGTAGHRRPGAGGARRAGTRRSDRAP